MREVMLSEVTSKNEIDKFIQILLDVLNKTNKMSVNLHHKPSEKFMHELIQQIRLEVVMTLSVLLPDDKTFADLINENINQALFEDKIHTFPSTWGILAVLALRGNADALRALANELNSPDTDRLDVYDWGKLSKLIKVLSEVLLLTTRMPANSMALENMLTFITTKSPTYNESDLFRTSIEYTFPAIRSVALHGAPEDHMVLDKIVDYILLLAGDNRNDQDIQLKVTTLLGELNIPKGGIFFLIANCSYRANNSACGDILFQASKAAFNKDHTICREAKRALSKLDIKNIDRSLIDRLICQEGFSVLGNWGAKIDIAIRNYCYNNKCVAMDHEQTRAMVEMRDHILKTLLFHFNSDSCLSIWAAEGLVNMGFINADILSMILNPGSNNCHRLLGDADIVTAFSNLAERAYRCRAYCEILRLAKDPSYSILSKDIVNHIQEMATGSYMRPRLQHVAMPEKGHTCPLGWQ